jgi:DNA polymerase-3 subunit beta
MITLPAATIKGLLRIAPKAEARYYLNGIYFDPKGYAVVTDGKMILAVKCEKFAPSADTSVGAEGFIVPRDVLAAAIKGVKPRMVVTVTRSNVSVDHMELAYTPIDGRFPDWRRAVPTACTGEVAHYDSQLTDVLREAFEDIDAPSKVRAYVSIAMNGTRGGVVRTGPDKLAVVMPFRVSEFDAAAHVAKFLGIEAPAQSEVDTATA